MTTTTISSGVSSSGLTVSGGEYLEVQRGGAVTGTVVSSGGHLLDFGHDAGTVIEAGGHETIASAGIAYHPVVSSGGVLLDEGRILGGLTVDGGFAELRSMQDANIEGLTVTLAHSGIVELDLVQNISYAGTKFAGLDHKGTGIELAGFNPKNVFFTWSQGVGSGVLTIHEPHGFLRTFDLIGTFKRTDFQFQSNNTGKIILIDARATANFVQAAAAMSPTPGASVHHGGSAAPIAPHPLAAVASSGR